MLNLPLTTKLLFLDMDGVVNSRDASQTLLHEPELHCPALVNILNGLSEIKDLKVVLSSTWRLQFDTPEKVNEMFSQIGLKLDCIGVTPYGGYCRGEEIERWLKENIAGYQYYLYKRYVILDDDSDMLLSQARSYFNVDNSVGITENIIYRVVNYFKGFDG